MTKASDFEVFYAENFRVLTMQLYAYCGNLADAQEVVQEACCRALARWHQLSQYEDPAGWVRRVAWNLATSQWRRARKLSTWTPDDLGPSASGPTPDRVDLVNALAKLPDGQRRVVVMHYLGDMSVNEISEMSRVPVGTIKSWMSRARTTLSTQLSESDPIRFARPRVAGQDIESVAAGQGTPAPQPAGLGLSVTDPLTDLFDGWAEHLSPEIAAPGVRAASRTVAHWRRLDRAAPRPS